MTDKLVHKRPITDKPAFQTIFDAHITDSISIGALFRRLPKLLIELLDEGESNTVRTIIVWDRTLKKFKALFMFDEELSIIDLQASYKTGDKLLQDFFTSDKFTKKLDCTSRVVLRLQFGEQYYTLRKRFYNSKSINSPSIDYVMVREPRTLLQRVRRLFASNTEVITVNRVLASE